MNHMKENIHQIQNYFIPASYRIDELEFRKSRILVNITLITSSFACGYFIQSYIFEQTHIMKMMALWAILFAALAFLFKYGVPRKVCSNTYIAITLISALWEIYWTDGLSSSILPWLSMTPVTAILLNSQRNAIVWFIITFISVTGVYVSDSYIDFQMEMNMSYYALSQYLAYAGLIGIMFIIAMVMERAFIGSLHKLGKKNAIIEQEKKKADDLLLNILPTEVIEELKLTGKTAAKNYSLVTVLFADFINFTNIIEEITPEELVSGIADYFEAFDNIIEKNEIEKIKTVGDAYICASGLPIPNVENPVIMARVAIDILDAVRKINHRRKAENKIYFEIRIGINSGPVVAGVVGVKKFAYDIWGDTVNMAARMQQNGKPNSINISSTTYDLIKHRFKCEHRGRIEIKHKGKIDMYYIKSSYT